MKKHILLSTCILLFHTILAAQWVSTKGSYGGTVHQTCSNENYLFAIKNSGLYRSADDALTWTLCDSTNLFGKIAIDGKNLLVSYFNNNQGFFRYSSDNGDHWLDVPLPAGTQFITNFSVKDGVVVYAYQSKLWRSDDFGQHWENFVLPGESFHVYQLLNAYDGLFYLGNRTRLFSSADGLNWTYNSNVPGNGLNGISAFFKNEDVMLSISAGQIGFSLNGGLDWSNGMDEENGNLTSNNFFSYDNGVYYLSSGEPMFKSTDNGLTWAYVNADGPDIYYHSSRNNVIIGHQLGKGLFRSTDGGQSFQTANHGLGGGDVSTISLQNDELWLWDEAGAVRQNINQLDWDALPDYPASTFMGNFVTVFHFKDAVFVRDDYGELLRSVDDGQNWATVTPHSSILASGFIKHHQKGDTLFISDESYKTYLSTDLGEQWELINPLVDGQINNSMKAMAVQGETIFVTDNLQIYRSENHLNSFQLVGNTMPFGSDVSLIRLFATPKHLFAFVNHERLFRSDDQGNQWAEIFIPFHSTFSTWVENDVQFAEINNALIAFFERAGVFVSYDKGQNWESFNENIPYSNVSTCFAYNESSMWVGTHLFGLYTRSTSDILTINSTNTVFENKALEISPNPNRGVFSCKLPAEIRGEVTILIHDPQGRQLQQQVDSAVQLPSLDLSAFGSGIFFISIITNQGLFAGKVVVF